MAFYWNDPEAKAMGERIAAAYDAYSKARSRVGRCRLPASLDAARNDLARTEKEYRRLSGERDELMEILKARYAQRGEEG